MSMVLRKFQRRIETTKVVLYIMVYASCNFVQHVIQFNRLGHFVATKS